MLTRSQTLEHLRLAESNGRLYAEHQDLNSLKDLELSVVSLCKPYKNDPELLRRGGQTLAHLMRLHSRLLVRSHRWLHA
ncbi:hypothetical protein GCM10008938_48250 [Deinococcus roseus]|uniref:Uncharacterized protein n=1 Tax=Deinococcus roseus TaxID=392414 RepID=A0ABQ2DK61_9DEIO|nr:hypothetical protein GCM10008938_48250 [Deinococcus roseus]